MADTDRPVEGLAGDPEGQRHHRDHGDAQGLRHGAMHLAEDVGEARRRASEVMARIEWQTLPRIRHFHEFWYSKRSILVCVLAALVTFVLLWQQDATLRATMTVFVFAACAWLLEPIPLYMTGLAVPMLLVLMGVFDPDEAFRPFSNSVIFLMIGGLVLAQALQKHGLDHRIAYATLLWSRGRIDRLVLLMMLVTAFLSMWMSNTAAVAVLLPVTFSVMAALPPERENLKWKLLLGLTLSSILGGMAMLTGTPPNLIAADALAGYDTFDFARWALIGLPVSMLSLLAIFYVLKRRYPSPDITLDLEAVRRQRDEAGPLSRDQRAVLAIFAITILMWFFGANVERMLDLPPSLSSAAIVSIISVVMLSVMGLLDMEDVHEVKWEIIFLLGGGLVLGEALLASGAAERMGSFIADAGSGMPVVAIVAIFVVLTVVLTNFISNTATAAILVPIGLQTAEAMGIAPTAFVMAIGLSASIAFVTPVGTPSVALVYSTGKLPKRFLFTNGAIAAVITAALVLVAVWLAFLAF